jgi:uncharacterized repeat protein (TIGR01451 family)
MVAVTAAETASFHGEYRDPSWSPDGTKLALMAVLKAQNLSYTPEIARIDAAGGGFTQLTSINSGADSPSWGRSPNTGRDIEVFQSHTPDPLLVASQTLSFAITVSNHSLLAATQVNVQAQVPAGTSFVSVATSTGRARAPRTSRAHWERCRRWKRPRSR